MPRYSIRYLIKNSCLFQKKNICIRYLKYILFYHNIDKHLNVKLLFFHYRLFCIVPKGFLKYFFSLKISFSLIALLLLENKHIYFQSNDKLKLVEELDSQKHITKELGERLSQQEKELQELQEQVN